MSLLTMKYNEEEMYRVINAYLRPNEQIKAAVYCSFQQTGFLASNRNVEVGYIALTDFDRLVGTRSSFLHTEHFSYELALLQKLKIKKGLFGARYIDLEGAEGRLKCVITPKIAGGKFPNHKENCAWLIEAFEEKQASMQ